ncbi:VCBS repeat-containing protein [Streptomyces sp. NPDC051211]|uniref:FG-GAP repeat domain-containing protein n=1 Tax=Streptomyces sp. NPDC051211 TaxID=3154643 RepID=UPI0034500C48
MALDEPILHPQHTAKPQLGGNAAKPRLDLDGDGWSDVLVRNSKGKSSSLLSTVGKTGGFTFNGSSQAVPRDVVALGNIRGGWGTEVLQWYNDGRLSMHQAFSSSTQAPTWTGHGWQVYNKLIAAGDLTKDGRGDLLARTPSGDLYLYRATGAATGNPFAGKVKVGSGWKIYDQIVGANDLDADGIADLVAKDLNGNLYYFKGTGSASAPFKPRTWVGDGWNEYNKIMAVDDQNGDGKADLYGVALWGQLYFHASEGNGKFTARKQIGHYWIDSETWVNSGVTPVYGKHGVYLLDWYDWIREAVNLTNGRFAGLTPLDQNPPPFPSSELVTVAGLDSSNRSYPFSFDRYAPKLINTTKGKSVWTLPTTDMVIGPGDLTGDGKGDLLFRESNGRLSVRAGNGDGVTFDYAGSAGTGWDTYKTIVGGGDISGDGRPDIVAASHDGHLYLYKGTGKASAPFTAREWYSHGWNGYNGIAVPGDLNGDGRADLIARDGDGTMWLYRSQGWGGAHTFASREWLDSQWNRTDRSFN